jgi:hypothetical protein
MSYYDEPALQRDVPPSGPILDGITRVEKANDVLRGVLGDLEARLGPVLADVVPAERAEKLESVRVARSPVAARLDGLCGQLESHVTRVRHVMERLEL